MKKLWQEIAIGMLGLMMTYSSLWADDEPKPTAQLQPRPQPAVRSLAYRVAGKHWLGVHAIPVDEALKSQLGIEDRLILAHVVPDSPAAKAGLKQHDILLRLGDNEITNMPDLLSAVEKNEVRETKLTVLRQGKELVVTVQPTAQPEQELHVDWHQAFPGRVEWQQWQQWLDQSRPLGLKVVGPGVFAFAQTEENLPNNLSISVTEQGSEPAKITVKRDGKTWEGTENELDKFPDDVRIHVERALGRREPHARLQLQEGGHVLIAPQPIAPVVVEQPRRVEVYERRTVERDPIQGLREEIEALRRVIERLEQKLAPADSKAE